MSRSEAIVLYVHGARDSRWAEPFLRLRERVAARAPQRIVAIAFLDYMSPDLVTAVRQLSTQGVAHIKVVPMFFGRGGHLRDDFPKQLEAARAVAPGVTFEVTQAAGESEALLDALATFAVDAPATPRNDAK